MLGLDSCIAGIIHREQGVGLGVPIVHSPLGYWALPEGG
uniref:Uncharacterized protein n=1 Tax=Picea glauca TaxID=3330 RepID=A0A101M103_PICGL|nr:hypothetical protein ABT39_MTgene4352 [Picea glauca]